MLTASDRLSEFARDGEIDFSYTVGGLARFRVNAFRQRGSISIALRVVPFGIKTVEELGLPDVVSRLADEPRGIILVTGTTGSGKSTTLAAMVDQINRNYPRNIVTIEDPIEYLHRDQQSVIHQREVGFDTASFAKALRRVLRQDPDVILIGEMRDEETVATALSAAETGHLVLSTLHTIDAVETINRIVDFFPPHQHQQVRAMLAGALRGVISQRLVPTIDGKGRVPACEVLTMTGRVRDMIVDANETGKLGEVIAEGSYYGMQTFDQSLLQPLPRGQDLAGGGARQPRRTRTTSSCWWRREGQRSTLGGPDLRRRRERPPIGSAAGRTASEPAPEPASAGNGSRSPSTVPAGPRRAAPQYGAAALPRRSLNFTL